MPSFLPSFYLAFPTNLRWLRERELESYMIPRLNIEPTEYLPATVLRKAGDTITSEPMFPDFSSDSLPIDSPFGNMAGYQICSIYTGYFKRDVPRAERVLSYRVLSPHMERFITFGAEMTQAYRYSYELWFVQKSFREASTHCVYFPTHTYLDTLKYNQDGFADRFVRQRFWAYDTPEKTLPSTWLSRNGLHPGVGLARRAYRRFGTRLMRILMETFAYLVSYREHRFGGYVPSKFQMLLSSPNVDAGTRQVQLPNPVRFFVSYFGDGKLMREKQGK